jgi:hypothetical protein
MKKSLETESLLKGGGIADVENRLESSSAPLFRRDRSSEKLTRYGYRSINEHDIESHNNEGFQIGQLYRYTPTDKCPLFSVYRLPQTKDKKLFLGNINRKQLFVCLEHLDHKWVKISASQMEGWIILPLSFQSDRLLFQPISSYIAYEDNLSRHIFLGGGRCMIGPDTDYFIFTLVAIPISLFVYLFTVANQFSIFPSAVCTILAILLFVFCYANLIATAVIEPGIIPRQSRHSQVWDYIYTT